MKHRIAAGALVVNAERLLLVHHRKAGAYDFWVAPGGGVIGTEDLLAAAIRETAEETGLIIEPLALAYVEELISNEARQCKFWYLARAIGGELTTNSAAAQAEHIVEAAFLSCGELSGKVVFPPVVSEQFWADLRVGFTQPRYLGVSEMVSS
jgi:ADP-ribose pyrophosphatase YjhB (NUDIX family)